MRNNFTHNTQVRIKYVQKTNRRGKPEAKKTGFGYLIGHVQWMECSLHIPDVHIGAFPIGPLRNMELHYAHYSILLLLQTSSTAYNLFFSYGTTHYEPCPPLY